MLKVHNCNFATVLTKWSEINIYSYTLNNSRDCDETLQVLNAAKIQ